MKKLLRALANETIPLLWIAILSICAASAAHAQTTITGLPVGSIPASTDVAAFDQGGTATNKVSATQISQSSLGIQQSANAVQFATNTNIATLSGSQTLIELDNSNQTPVTNQTVLLINESAVTGPDGCTNSACNGLWIVNTSGAWARSPMMPVGEVIPVYCVRWIYDDYIESIFTMNTGNTPVTVGTTGQLWGFQTSVYGNNFTGFAGASVLLDGTSNGSTGTGAVTVAGAACTGTNCNGAAGKLFGGAGAGSGNGAAATAQGGAGGPTGNGANANLLGGAGGSTSGNGGNAVVKPGAVTSGTVGASEIEDSAGTIWFKVNTSGPALRVMTVSQVNAITCSAGATLGPVVVSDFSGVPIYQGPIGSGGGSTYTPVMCLNGSWVTD